MSQAEPEIPKTFRRIRLTLPLLVFLDELVCSIDTFLLSLCGTGKILQTPLKALCRLLQVVRVPSRNTTVTSEHVSEKPTKITRRRPLSRKPAPLHRINRVTKNLHSVLQRVKGTLLVSPPHRFTNRLRHPHAQPATLPTSPTTRTLKRPTYWPPPAVKMFVEICCNWPRNCSNSAFARSNACRVSGHVCDRKRSANGPSHTFGSDKTRP